MRSGTVSDLVFGDANLWLVALEALWLIVLVAVASATIFRFSGPLPDVPKTFEDDIDSPTGRSARISWLAGIVAVVAVWLAAATLTKGQALGAAVLGGFASGAFGRLLAPRTQPSISPLPRWPPSRLHTRSSPSRSRETSPRGSSTGAFRAFSA